MDSPWQALSPLPPAVFEQVRLQTIFDCFKWDPQVQDESILADFAILLETSVWQTIAAQAEQLAVETLAAEQEILRNPALHTRLGLPRSITRHWKHLPNAHEPPGVRVIRFDFHLTTDGWRISEANSDVPGGFIESAGYTQLMAAHYPQTAPVGDPADALAQAIRACLSPGALVALIHATAYTDDRQVMIYIAQYLERYGLKTCLISPAHLCWDGGKATLATDWQQGNVDFLLRFFPAEWLPNLPRALQWQNFFSGSHIPACNPTWALISQSKRFPLVWEMLHTSLPTWKHLLPETRDPRQIDKRHEEGWIFKPALGRVGEDIGMQGVTTPKAWKLIKRSVKWQPAYWAAQRRFEAVPLVTENGNWYPCIGVYTINGRTAGAYGRMSNQPLINSTAKDVAILINRQP